MRYNTIYIYTHTYFCICMYVNIINININNIYIYVQMIPGITWNKYLQHRTCEEPFLSVPFSGFSAIHPGKR